MAVQQRGRGRPRSGAQIRTGKNTREEILDAAAELFTTQGFSPTTTRQIADAVGVRQNALYNHFASKDAILGTVLGALVRPSLKTATMLDAVEARDNRESAAKLYALAYFDGDVLTTWQWNLGVLFALPETRMPTFEEARTARYLLRDIYVRMTADLTTRMSAPSAGDQTFRLVESISAMRSDNKLEEDVPHSVARSCLQIAGWTEGHAEARARAESMLHNLGLTPTRLVLPGA
jgi:AcrR family transcriptional regulator